MDDARHHLGVSGTEPERNAVVSAEVRIVHPVTPESRREGSGCPIEDGLTGHHNVASSLDDTEDSSEDVPAEVGYGSW